MPDLGLQLSLAATGCDERFPGDPHLRRCAVESWRVVRWPTKYGKIVGRNYSCRPLLSRRFTFCGGMCRGFEEGLFDTRLIRQTLTRCPDRLLEHIGWPAATRSALLA